MRAATARHRVANLLHGYTEIADRKDVAAAVHLLGEAAVTFPSGVGFDSREGAEAFFAALWSGPLPHRHDVANLVVEPHGSPGLWTARAHYTRWTFDPDPVLHTLGAYELVVAETPWRITHLTVTRSWTRP